MNLPAALVETTLQVARPMLVAYGELTGDSNPIHLDPAFAATTAYGRCIAHGTLSLNALWQSIGATFDAATAACLDLDIRFTAPVFVGEVLTGGGTLLPGTGGRYDVWVRAGDRTVIAGELDVRPPPLTPSAPDTSS